jgi:hypothetical protein
VDRDERPGTRPESVVDVLVFPDSVCFLIRNGEARSEAFVEALGRYGLMTGKAEFKSPCG